MLEATCGGLAARRASQEQIAGLESACEGCEAALRQGDADVYYRENEMFHQILYAASANSFLESEALKLQRRLQPFRRMQLRVRGRIGQSMDEHWQILAAIKTGDAAQAEAVIRAHIAVQGQKFNDLVASYQIATQRKAG